MARSDALGYVLQPGEPEDEWAEEEAAMHVRPDRDEQRDEPQDARVPARRSGPMSTSANRAIPKSWGRRASAGAATDERCERQERRLAVRACRPAADAKGSRRSALRAPPRRTTRPVQPATSIDGGKQDLRAPLLVEPGQPAAVNVQVSTVGIPASARIWAPARAGGQVHGRQLAMTAASVGSATARNAQSLGRVITRGC